MAPIAFNDLRPQYAALRAELDAAVTRVLERGWFILGPELEAFEAEFAAYCGARHAVGVGSGTDALHLALRACGVGPGDEVITVAFTAVPTINA
ncbi:MAG: DegT/DnrJ/EryC1/StrS family aminotransferase, partial [Chloroflexi bacterium]|nr:DegT/DnrJ/EryC1/StrS family aminotransferase [Chloroflexota bacterium]